MVNIYSSKNTVYICYLLT